MAFKWRFEGRSDDDFRSSINNTVFLRTTISRTILLHQVAVWHLGSNLQLDFDTETNGSHCTRETRLQVLSMQRNPWLNRSVCFLSKNAQPKSENISSTRPKPWSHRAVILVVIIWECIGLWLPKPFLIFSVRIPLLSFSFSKDYRVNISVVNSLRTELFVAVTIIYFTVVFNLVVKFLLHISRVPQMWIHLWQNNVITVHV